MSTKGQKPLQQKSKIENKESKSPKQMIDKINQSFEIDRIILEYGLQKYERKQIIKGKPTYKQVQQFFQYLKQNEELFQQQYLKVVIEEDEQEQNLNYLQNKANIQKFIKDEHKFYQNVLKHHQENVNQDQNGLNAKNISNFMKELLTGKYTKCIQYKNQYFDSNSQTLFRKITTNYAIQIKQISKEDFQYDHFYLMEDEILDYLTFWLKDQQNQCLHIIYFRTESFLKKKLENIEIENDNKQILEKKNQIKIPEQIQKQSVTIQNKILKQMKSTQQLKKSNNMKKFNQMKSDILSKYSIENENQQNLNKQQMKKSHSKTTLSNQQKFQRFLPELYSQICSKRSKILKGITFDEFLADKNIMTLEKFINFCIDFSINKYLNRQILIDTFKIYAINRITANQKIFIQIMNQLVQKNNQIMALVLQKGKRQFKTKQKKNRQFQKDKLSKYSYRLRPVNGMDLQSIQAQLKSRKEEKQYSKQVKKDKQDLMVNKQLGYLSKFKANKIRGSSHSNYALSKKTENFDSFPLNQEKFDPQSMISNFYQNDKLWDEYEAKIWKKQKSNQSILQQALTKRIQKGENVLKKFTQKSIKIYS